MLIPHISLLWVYSICSPLVKWSAFRIVDQGCPSILYGWMPPPLLHWVVIDQGCPSILYMPGNRMAEHNYIYRTVIARSTYEYD